MIGYHFDNKREATRTDRYMDRRPRRYYWNEQQGFRNAYEGKSNRVWYCTSRYDLSSSSPLN